MEDLQSQDGSRSARNGYPDMILTLLAFWEKRLSLVGCRGLEESLVTGNEGERLPCCNRGSAAHLFIPSEGFAVHHKSQRVWCRWVPRNVWHGLWLGS